MFNPQTEKPIKENKYYITKAAGGYNAAIAGKVKATGAPDQDCDVLANCVGYANGRYAEIQGLGYIKYQLTCNAEDFVSRARALGLKVGITPKLGGIMVWRKGKTNNSEDGAGHVCIVEGVYDDYILTSHSGWNSKPFWTEKIKLTAQEYRCTWQSKDYYYVGCVYQPQEVKEMTQAEFNEMIKAYLIDLKDDKASSYAADALKWAKSNGLLSGDEKGNQMPKSFLTREDLAVILKRFSQIK